MLFLFGSINDSLNSLHDSGRSLIGIDKILLQGGPTLDGSFIKDNLIDAISIIISPVTSLGGDTLFKPSKYMEFKLVKFKQLSNSNVWLHYVKK